METIARNAPGICCCHCVATVEDAVGKIDGVQLVSADAASRAANVTDEASTTDVAAITAALEDAGYPARQ